MNGVPLTPFPVRKDRDSRMCALSVGAVTCQIPESWLRAMSVNP